MYKRLILLILITSAFSNCSTDNSLNFVIIEGKKPIVSQLSIKLDSIAANQVNYGAYFSSSGKNYYAWVDPNFLTVRVYSFSEKTTFNKNLFEIKNNNLFLSQLNNPVFASFFIWNDQLVTFNKFNLGNSQVLEIPTLEITDTLSIGNGNVFKSINYTTNPLTLIDNTLFFTVDPEIDLNKPINQDSIAWLQAVNLQTGEHHKIQLPVPIEYKNKIICASALIPSTTINQDNNIVLSWPGSLDLAIYNPANDKVSILTLAENLTLSAPSFQKSHYFDCNSQYQETTQIEMIKYNQKKNTYYFFYSKPNKLDGKTLGLLVLDTAFKLTSSVELKANTYNLNGAFVSDEGIALPKTNPFNTKIDEEYIHFDIFSFN